MQKREEIKNRARELFLRFGFQKTSMDDIAHAVNIAKPTLYYYYKSKEELFNEILLDEAQKFLNQAMQKVPTESSAEEKLYAFYEAVYSNLEKIAREVINTDDYMMNSSPHGKPVVEKITQMITDYLRPMLQQGIDEGIFQIHDLESTIFSLLSVTRFLNLHWIKLFPKKKRDKAFKIALQFIICGLKGGIHEK